MVFNHDGVNYIDINDQKIDTISEFVEQIYKRNPVKIYNRGKTFSFHYWNQHLLLTMEVSYDEQLEFNRSEYSINDFIIEVKFLLRKEKILKLRSK